MEKEHFKVGDRVFCYPGFEGDAGGYGTIISIEPIEHYIYTIEFDNRDLNRHDCYGKTSDNKGYFYTHDLKYIQLAEEHKSQGKYAPIIRKIKQLDEKFKNRKNPCLDIPIETGPIPTVYVPTTEYIRIPTPY